LDDLKEIRKRQTIKALIKTAEMRFDNLNDLVHEYDNITPAQVQKKQEMRITPELLKKTEELEEARKELMAVREAHLRMKTDLERACPFNKLDMITELVK
jgi:hypothetical protein